MTVVIAYALESSALAAAELCAAFEASGHRVDVFRLPAPEPAFAAEQAAAVALLPFEAAAERLVALDLPSACARHPAKSVWLHDAQATTPIAGASIVLTGTDGDARAVCERLLA